MNTATLMSDSWTWLAIAGLVAALWWWGRGSRRQATPSLSASGHQGGRHREGEGRLERSVDAPEVSAAAPNQEEDHPSRAAGGRRRHGCC